VVTLAVPDDERTDPDALAAALRADHSIGHVALVYSETGSGVIHDVPALADICGRAGRRVIVDAVSAFGALPLNLAELPMIDAVVFTANKCLEGLPGLAFAVARIDRLLACQNQAGSWSLDLADVYQHALRVGWGCSRFTPSAQAIAAFAVALDLFDAEGGQPARLARYTANMRALYDGAREIGLVPYLSRATQGPIVVNIHAPADPAWNLQAFVEALKEKGFLISNFYNTDAPSFRIGCIGAVTPDDMRAALRAIDEVLVGTGIRQRKAA
jgi:2-aminoethylphosphonate-pyruvate transaminase